jgi:hypothetical protein
MGTLEPLALSRLERQTRDTVVLVAFPCEVGEKFFQIHTGAERTACSGYDQDPRNEIAGVTSVELGL